MNEQKKDLLKAKVALALRDTLNRQPSENEVQRYWIAAQVLYKTILGLHYERQAQKRNGQLAIF